MLYNHDEYRRRHDLSVIPNNHCKIRCEECCGTGFATELKVGHKYGDIKCFYCEGDRYFYFDPHDMVAVEIANGLRR